MINLSVVIPSYNETANLKRGVLDEVNSYLQKQNFTWEVLISDDGSSENEAKEIARTFCESHPGFTFLGNPHQGKAQAVWSGVQHCQGKIILFTDMDQSTPISEIEKLLPYYDQGFDVVVGSRGSGRKNFSIFRMLASTIFRYFRRSLLLWEIVDTQCGFKTLRSEIAKEVFPLLDVIKDTGQASGWKVTSFDVDLLVAAKVRGYKLKEVPVDWADRDVSTGKSRGTSKFVKESLDMIKETLRVKMNVIRGVYNK